MRCSKISMKIVGLLFLFTTLGAAWGQDPGWPRQIVRPGGTVMLYQPQVDEWNHYTDVKWRMAFQLTPAGGKQVVGAFSASASTQVDTDTHMVFIYNIVVDHTYFPGQDPGTTAQLDQLVRSFMPPTINIVISKTACVPEKLSGLTNRIEDA